MIFCYVFESLRDDISRLKMYAGSILSRFYMDNNPDAICLINVTIVMIEKLQNSDLVYVCN